MVFTAILFWLSVLTVLYTLVGYPLIIALLARGRERREYSQQIEPEVTLIIPAYNEAYVIGRKLENSLALNYPKEKLQILVAADGSDDDTPEIVREYGSQGVELNYVPERNGKMAAMNRAVKKARGDVIVFSDANNFYDKDTIKNLVFPFEAEEVGGTTGAKLIIDDERDLSSAESFYWKYESKIKLNESIVSSCTSAVGEMLAIRKDLFVTPPSNIINDDRYMAVDLIRRGYRVEYVPEARSFEYVSASAKDEMKRRRRMNAGGFQLISLSKELLPKNNYLEIWKIVSHKYLRTAIPFALILVLVTNLVAVFAPGSENRSLLLLGVPFNWILLVLQLVFYGLAVLGNTIPLNGKSKIKKFLYLPAYFVNSNLAIIFGLIMFLRDENSHIWERVNRVEM